MQAKLGAHVKQVIQVLVHLPAHSQMGSALSYWSEQAPTPGSLVRVPLGQRELLGVVWDGPAAAAQLPEPEKLRPLAGVLDGIAPLSAAWRQLLQFSASYYQRSIGEVVLAALPPQLRELNPEQMQRRLQRKAAQGSAQTQAPTSSTPKAPPLSAEQTQVVANIEASPGPFLLFGATGSGKTEVYLQAVQRLLQADPQAQALLMVPEINLTPQLEARVRERFGDAAVVSMHSGLTGPQRLKSWLAAHTGFPARRLPEKAELQKAQLQPGAKLVKTAFQKGN